MTWQTVYLGLGSNIGDSFSILKNALGEIGAIPGVSRLECSSIYETTPVSDIPQGNFLNCVCRLKTTLDPRVFFSMTEQIEKNLGKIPKNKNAPRMLDIDILFFGNEPYQDEVLTIPHPRWKERLFVLIPLLDLTDNIDNINLRDYTNNFSNVNNEQVVNLSSHPAMCYSPN